MKKVYRLLFLAMGKIMVVMVPVLTRIHLWLGDKSMKPELWPRNWPLN